MAKKQKNLRLLTISQIAAILSVSDRQIRKLVEKGRFPRPLKLGGASRWRVEDIEKYIDGKAEAR